jgi:hypothetical protein
MPLKSISRNDAAWPLISHCSQQADGAQKLSVIMEKNGETGCAVVPPKNDRDAKRAINNLLLMSVSSCFSKYFRGPHDRRHRQKERQKLVLAQD